VEGDRGVGDLEKRREKRGQEVGFPRWREVGEKGKSYPTLHNILQSKNCKRREPGLKGTESGRFKPPCPTPKKTALKIK